MEIVDFRSKKFSEIPTQDNPAYDVHECLLICKAENEQTGLYVLLKIEENEPEVDELKQLALFWDIEIAVKVAYLLANKTPA